MSAAPPYGNPVPPPQHGYQPAPPNFNNAPPPYYPPPAQMPQMAPPPAQQPVSQQQSSTNVVVVQSQPTPGIVVHTVQPVGDHFLTLSIILTVLCVLFGTWYGLFCTIPAMIFSIMARDADQRGDMATAQTHGRISLGLNITSLVSWVIIAVISVALIVVFVGRINTYCDSYRYYNYYYDDYYYCY